MTVTDVLRALFNFLRKHIYVLCVFFALAIGVAIGIMLKVFDAPPEAAVWLGLPGELFLRALRFCVIPLLCCNIIYVSSSIDPKMQGTSALLALIYCLAMNIMSSFIGGLVTFGIKPGSYARMSDAPSDEGVVQQVHVSDIIADMFRNMIPDNFVSMFLSAVVTTYKNISTSANPSELKIQRVLQESPGVNILGLLVSSVLIGLVSGSLNATEVSPFIRFFKAAAQALTRLLEKVMILLPLGMASLVLKAIADIDEVWGTLKALGFFIVTNVAFLALIAFVLLPVVYLCTTRHNPFSLLLNGGIGKSLLTAFSTVSSLTALPDIFACVEGKFGMNPTSSRLLGPFLTSFNANGSSAFIASCILFCAQWSGVEINVGNMIAILFLAGLNVMALPAVPSSSVVIVILLLRSFGIPEDAAFLIYIPEFLNDRLRTIVNVESHTICLLVVNSFEKRREGKLSFSEALSLSVEVIDKSEDSSKSKHGIQNENDLVEV